MKKVAILQSNYIPWKGYFDLIASVDEFILYDDMQYTRRDWRNRNQIKTPQGIQWLTIPVQVKGKYHQLIRETETESTRWAAEHWKTLVQNYRSAGFFNEVAKWLEPIYVDCPSTNLSQINRRFIVEVCKFLEIDTLITNSWDYNVIDGKTERLVDLCVKSSANEYISGPSAKGYIEEQQFADANIKLTWFDYNGYPEYPQLWGEFTHGVSIVDMLFNCGLDARKNMRFVR